MASLNRNLIAGEWVEGASITHNVSPSNTDDVIGDYAQADAVQTEAAIAAAKSAFPRWSRTAPQERREMLLRVANEISARRDELGRLLAREEGKTLPEAVGEVTRAGQIFDFFAGEVLRIAGEKFASLRPNVDVEVTREPIGVIGVITPWNFPMTIPAWKIAPALAYGNTVVFKPADLVPASAHALSEILERAGVPKGVFNLVMGRGSVVGEAILANKAVDAISFTGSIATGRRVAAACSAERCASSSSRWAARIRWSCSLTPICKTAVECAVNGAYFSTGQRCTASSRLIVTRGHLQALRRRADRTHARARRRRRA